MKSFVSKFSLLFVLCAVPASLISLRAQSPSSADADQKALLAIEQQMLSADGTHDVEAMSKYLDDSYLVMDLTGGIFDKSSALREMQFEAEQERKTGQKQPPPKVEDPQVAVLKDSPLVVSRITIPAGPQPMTCDMIDTFIRRAAGWKLVSRSANCH